MPDARRTLVLTLTCRDAVGIVAAVAGFLAERDGFIVESQQYADLTSGRFFARIEFSDAGPRLPGRTELAAEFTPLAGRFGMDWQISDTGERPRTLVMVSRSGHCLNDLLHRWRTGSLPAEVAGVASNHEDLRGLVEWHQLPFHHIPVPAGGKRDAEARMLDLVENLDAELVVLARYMQVLGAEVCERLDGRVINIHHSFLPSFKGAGPYHQAHARGVKLIGATAHFVTPDLDDGPIIEQATERVEHWHTPTDLVRIGRDVEAQVLARAVTWVAERRVLMNGMRTVVFPR